MKKCFLCGVVILLAFSSMSWADTMLARARGPWVEAEGLIDSIADDGQSLVLQGLLVNIADARFEDVWRPLEPGFLIEVEGILDMTRTPPMLIAVKLELEGIGYAR